MTAPMHPDIAAGDLPKDDLLDGEHAENLIRKDFTVSERVAIGRSMAMRLGERRGNPTGANQYGEGKAQDFAQFHDEKTRDLAASYAGFGNHETYRQAAKVCDQGMPELVALMDDGGISIEAAARLADYPEEVQRQAVKRIREGDRELDPDGWPVGMTREQILAEMGIDHRPLIAEPRK